MKYAVGIDNGGTTIKAAVFDEGGLELASAGRFTPLIKPKPGYMERDMEQMWEINCECVREALERSGVPPANIAGLAVCGHGKGLYAWGKDNRPAYSGIISTDNRAWRQVEDWKNSGIDKALYPQLCQQLLPTQQAALLAWMKENAPSVYHNIKWVFSAKDYIRFRLTDEAFCEVTDISGSGLMDVANVRFDSHLLKTLGIGEVFDKLAPLRYSYELCGSLNAEAAKLTGIPKGTPVAGGMFDIDACAVAMDITSPEQLCTITGTWSINEFISEKPVLNTAIAMNSLYAVPGYYLIEESSPTSAGNLEWALDNLMKHEPLPENKKLYHLADEMVGNLPPENSDVYYLPFLYGTNAHPLAKASFVGLTSYHTRADMLRAVYESAAYTAKTHIDKLLSVRKHPTAVRMAGGVANAPMWVDIFANVLNLPIETVGGVKELGAMGCAMAAFIAAGTYKNYKDAAKKMVKISPAVRPTSEKSAVYTTKYEKYTAIKNALNTVWGRFEV